MADLKIPNLTNNSKQYLFKNKLSIRRKSKTKLFKESFLMIFSSVFLILLNYFIPQKISLFRSISGNFLEFYGNLKEILYYFYELLLVLFIVISSLMALFLALGGIFRIYKISKIKTKKIPFR